MSMADEIQKLEQLRLSGALTEDEFQTAKMRVLRGNGAAFNDSVERVLDSVGLGTQTSPEDGIRNYSMWLHLSMLSNLCAPGAGYVLPVVLWQTKKENSVVDQHGRNAINFQICQLILAVVGAILTTVIIGFFILLGVFIMSIVCPILIGLKARRGVVEKYPLTYDFLKGQ